MDLVTLSSGKSFRSPATTAGYPMAGAAAGAAIGFAVGGAIVGGVGGQSDRAWETCPLPSAHGAQRLVRGRPRWIGSRSSLAR